MADTLVQDPPSAPPSTPDASQTPPPAADAAPAPKVTDAQTARFKKHAANVLGISFEEEKPADAPKQEDAPAEAEAAPSADAPKPPKVAPKKPAPRVIPPPPERDRAEENKELATSVAKAVASELKPKQEATAKGIELSSEDKAIVEVLGKMGEMFPERKTLATDYQNALVAQEQYEKRWQDANPNDTFDPDAEEHAAFYQRNYVDIPDKIYQIAASELAAEKKSKPLQDRLAAEERERARVEKLRDSEPAIQREQIEAGKMVLDLFEDGPEGYIKDDLSVDPAKLAKYTEDHPLEGAIYGNAITATANIARTAHQLFNGLVAYNKEDKGHAIVQQAATDLEGALLALPPEQRLNDKDQLFIAYNEFYALKPDKRAKYWTVDAKALNQFVAGKNAEFAKMEVKKQREWVSRVTKQPISTNGHVPQTAPATIPKTEPKPLVPKVRMESPGATAEPLVPRGQAPPTKGKLSNIERFNATMLG